MATKQTVGELIYKITGDSKGFGASIAKADNQVKGLGNSINSMSLKSVAKMAALGLSVGALGGVMVSATRKAIEFETRMGNIQTLIGDDAAGVDKLRDGILELSKSIPKSADELGAASYDILSAGITDAGDALEVLEASGKLAVAGLGSTTEAVNLTTSAINAFKIPAEEADDVANTVFETVRAGKTTVAELAQSFGNVAAAAQGAGVSFKETQAATAALTTVGFKTATAQDRLRALFDEMTRSSGKLADGIKGVGIENIETAIKTDGFKDVLDQLYKATGENDIAFKNMFSSVEAGGAAVALVNGASETYNDTLEKMTGNTNSLEGAFETQAETTANQLVLAQNQLNELMVNFGSVVLPAINKALETTLDLFFGFSNLINENTKQVVENTKKQDELFNAYKDYKKVATEAREAGDENTASMAEAAGKAQLLLSQTVGLTGSEEDNAKMTDLLKQRRELLTDEVRDFIKAQKDGNAVTEEATGTAINLATEIENAEKAQKEAAKAAEQAAKELENFQGKMVDMIETSKEASQALREDFTDALADTQKGLAEIALKAEDEIASIKERIRNEEDSDRKKELRKELEAQEEILESREGFEERKAQRLSAIRERLEGAGINTDEVSSLLEVQSLEEEIQQQREEAQLNEFQRFEEQQFAKIERIVDDIITRRQLEEELTAFLLAQNSVRTASVDEFANNAISKYGEMASALRSAISLQSRLNAMRSNPNQFHEGGYVGAGGGEVHAGEYVIPANLVSKFGSVVSSLENARSGGGSVNNSRTVNAPITMNNSVNGNLDFRTVGRELAWRLGSK